jgi:CubicO group peptidase (beta-lactamase class C family)
MMLFNKGNSDFRSHLVMLLFCILLHPVGWCQNLVDPVAPVPADRVGLRTLSGTIDSILEAENVPGAAVALFTADTVFFVHCSGYANLEEGRKVTPSTLFRVSSITKSFVGLACMRLVYEGKLDLFSPVAKLVPEIACYNRWEGDSPLRVVHLLEHTAGFNDHHFSNYNTSNPDVPLPEGLMRTTSNRVSRWKPGSVYSYSGEGYQVAGCIIEKVTHQRFEQFVDEQVLKPLQMNRSSMFLTPEVLNSLATGYDRAKMPQPYPFVFARPAASLHASLDDMVLFGRHLLKGFRGDGFPLLPDSLFRRFIRGESTEAARAGYPVVYGKGISVFSESGHTWFGHNGSDPGFASMYRVCPELGVGFVVLTNRFDKFGLTGITALKRSVNKFLASLYHVPVKAVTPVAYPDDVPEGVYVACNSRQALFSWFDYFFNVKLISRHDDGLSISNFPFGEKERMSFVSRNSFFAGDDSLSVAMVFRSAMLDRPLLVIGYDCYWQVSKPLLVFYFMIATLIVVVMITTLLSYPVLVVVATVRWFRRRTGWRVLIPFHGFFWGIVLLVVGVEAFAGLSLVEMGRKNTATLVYQWASILYFVLTVAGFVVLAAKIVKGGNWFARTLWSAYAALMLTPAVFLLFQGLIGLRFWHF